MSTVNKFVSSNSSSFRVIGVHTDRVFSCCAFCSTLQISAIAFGFFRVLRAALRVVAAAAATVAEAATATEPEAALPSSSYAGRASRIHHHFERGGRQITKRSQKKRRKRRKRERQHNDSCFKCKARNGEKKRRRKWGK